jgi:hypothetical protein
MVFTLLVFNNNVSGTGICKCCQCTGTGKGYSKSVADLVIFSDQIGIWIRGYKNRRIGHLFSADKGLNTLK